MRGKLRHRTQDIPFGKALRGLESSVRGDVEVVPRLRVGILRRMAGVVHPVRPVDRRLSVQNPVDGFCRFFGEVVFGNGGRDVMSLLSPTESRTGDNQPQAQQNQPFHTVYSSSARYPGQWFIVARNSSFVSVSPICFWRNSMASTGVMSERYLRSTHVRFITSRGSSRSSRRVPDAMTSTAG